MAEPKSVENLCTQATYLYVGMSRQQDSNSTEAYS